MIFSKSPFLEEQPPLPAFERTKHSVDTLQCGKLLAKNKYQVDLYVQFQNQAWTRTVGYEMDSQTAGATNGPLAQTSSSASFALSPSG